MSTVELLRHMAGNFAYAAHWQDLKRAADQLERTIIERDACLKRLAENDEEIKELRERLGRIGTE